MENIPIDDITPTDRSLIFDMRDNLIHTHGGVATRIRFKTATVMSIDEFLAKDLNELRSCRESLTVIRDSASSRNYLLYGDQAVRYDGCELDDVELRKMAEYLNTDSDKVFMPNVTYPIISWIENSSAGIKKIVVKLDNFSFRFSNNRMEVEETLYMPPLWFGITMTTAFDTRMLYVAVARENYPDCRDVKLQSLPLPNIYPSGRICVGVSKVSIGLGDKPSEGQLINLSINRFFNSGWNTDLLYDNFTAVLGGYGKPAYEKLAGTAPEIKKKYDGLIESHVSSSSVCDQYRVLAVLSQPNGWMDCSFQDLSKTTAEFLDGELL